MSNTPIIYTYIYMKLKENSRTSIINVYPLKETIARVIIRKGGLPKFMVKYVVDDLIVLGLLERLSKENYKILESNCDKRVKQLVASYC